MGMPTSHGYQTLHAASPARDLDLPDWPRGGLRDGGCLRDTGKWGIGGRGFNEWSQDRRRCILRLHSEHKP